MLPVIRIASNSSADGQPDHAVVFLHGLGAGPEDVKPIIESINFEIGNGIEYILPRAPQRPLTVFNGAPVTAWYDVYAWREGSGEDAEGLDAAAEQLAELIEDLVKQGFARRNIVVGGFSQGGACVLHYVSRSQQPLGGVIALSAYMPLGRTWKPISKNNIQQIPMFVAHGSEDSVLPLAYGDFAHRLLAEMGVPVTWRTYEGLGHSVDERVIHDLCGWLTDQLHRQPLAARIEAG